MYIVASQESWKSNVDFHCERCLEGSSVQSVSLREIVNEPIVKLECVSRFCYLGDTLGARGVEAARVRCAWARLKE